MRTIEAGAAGSTSTSAATPSDAVACSLAARNFPIEDLMARLPVVLELVPQTADGLVGGSLPWGDFAGEETV